MSTMLSPPRPTAPGGVQPLGFVPALDGVRALAVLIVVAYHGDWFRIQGGFIGVDVFFVLSGFLITRLLVDEHARFGEISLRSFYLRRALRLFPALAGLVAGVALAAALLDAPALEDNLTARSLWAISYVTNWHDVVTHTHGGPFSHTWSLSVEEQFYIVWPVVVIALLRHRGVAAVRAFAGMGYVVTAGMTALRFWNGANGFDLYFATHSHGLVLLLAGSCLGATPRLLELASQPMGRRLLAVGTAGVALLALLPDRFGPVHAGAGYLPVTVCSLALVSGATIARNTSLLTWGPLRRIGASSYGIYLWHLPMFTIAPIVAPAADPKLRIIIGTAIATVLSHVLIERPAMRFKHRWTRTEQRTPTEDAEPLRTAAVPAHQPEG
ncbi:MAG: acyltransferase [Acidimicrobiales bacterium]